MLRSHKVVFKQLCFFYGVFESLFRGGRESFAVISICNRFCLNQFFYLYSQVVYIGQVLNRCNTDTSALIQQS